MQLQEYDAQPTPNLFRSKTWLDAWHKAWDESLDERRDLIPSAPLAKIKRG